MIPNDAQTTMTNQIVEIASRGAVLGILDILRGWVFLYAPRGQINCVLSVGSLAASIHLCRAIRWW